MPHCCEDRFRQDWMLSPGQIHATKRLVVLVVDVLAIDVDVNDVCQV